MDKTTTSPELWSEFPYHLDVYTDGSEGGLRTAAAVAAPNTVKNVRLPDKD